MMNGMGFDPSSQIAGGQETQAQSDEVGQAGQAISRGKQLAALQQKVTDTSIEIAGGMLGSIDKVSIR